MPVSNDSAHPVPRTSFDGPTLTFDLPSVSVGVAEYEEGPTGCTVIAFDQPVLCAVDMRGGSPGFFREHARPDAICLAGGSIYGIEAAMGVQTEILAQREHVVTWNTLANVTAGIIWDFGPRDNTIYPDKVLGRAAHRAAVAGRFPQGARGAGRSASVGGMKWKPEPSGQGGAFLESGAIKMAVFTVVNAGGAVVDRSGSVVRGNLDPETGRRSHSLEIVRSGLAAPETQKGNSTLTIAVTNCRLNLASLRQLGRQVHSSMARAIQPFHCVTDGDILWMVTTNEVDVEDAFGANLAEPLAVMSLGVLLAEVAWDAVLASVL